jgi:hypothetical protein
MSAGALLMSDAGGQIMARPRGSLSGELARSHWSRYARRPDLFVRAAWSEVREFRDMHVLEED